MKLLINIIMRSVKMTAYESPKVWQWKEENSKKSGNRPTAGSVSSRNYQSERLRSNSIH